MRFSIKTMLAATAFIAASICGLLYANVIWAACFFTGALAAISYGLVAAFVTRESRRAFWIGFVVFGAGYFCISMMTKSTSQFAAERDLWYGRNLITTHFLIWSQPFVNRTDTDSAKSGPAYRKSLRAGGFGGLMNPQFPTNEFLQIGHSVFVVLVALVGGRLGSSLYRLGMGTD